MAKPFIIFDFDGTLVDSRPFFTKVFNEVAEKRGLQGISLEQQEHLRELSAREIIQMLGLPFYKLPLVLKYARERFYERLEEITMPKGVRSMLETLHVQGYRLAVVSSNSEKNIETFCRLHQLDMFEVIRGGSIRALFGKHKVIRKLIQTLAVPSEQAVYVGDEIRDIEAARKSAVKVIAVGWGYNTPQALQNNQPDYFAENPRDFLEIVGRL